MMNRRSIWGLAAVFAVCLAATAVNAQTVLIGPGINNGSFESPLIPGEDPNYNYLPAAPTDWSQADSCFFQNSPSGAYDVASDGDQGIAIANQDAQNPADADGIAWKVGITLEAVFEPYTVYTATMDINGNFQPGVVGGTWWMSDTAGSSFEQKDFTTTDGPTFVWESPEPLVVDTVLRPDFIGKYICLGIYNALNLDEGGVLNRPQLWVDNVNLVATPSTTVLGPGDANGDFVVDELDAAIMDDRWLLESGAIWPQGDFNGDGAINDVDATIMAVNWGRVFPAGGASVPEPATIVLCASAAIVILLMRRRRRSC